MGVDVATQLAAACKGLLLGASLGLAYDWLRMLRRIRPGRLLALLADGAFCLGGLWLLMSLALSAGGELRLYLILAAGLGGALYFVLFGALLRPLWGFWLGAAAGTLRVLRLPLEQFVILMKKARKKAKRLFYFWHKYVIIIVQQRKIPRPRRRSGPKEARRPVKAKSKKRRPNRLLALVVVVALLFGAWQLYQLYGKVQDAQLQQEALAAQVAAQQQANDALAADLQRADDPTYLQDLARDELGLVAPGERVFYDVG
jgi:cell division protein FtsB